MQLERLPKGTGWPRLPAFPSLAASAGTLLAGGDGVSARIRRADTSAGCARLHHGFEITSGPWDDAGASTVCRRDRAGGQRQVMKAIMLCQAPLDRHMTSHGAAQAMSKSSIRRQMRTVSHGPWAGSSSKSNGMSRYLDISPAGRLDCRREWRRTENGGTSPGVRLGSARSMQGRWRDGEVLAGAARTVVEAGPSWPRRYPGARTRRASSPTGGSGWRCLLRHRRPPQHFPRAGWR